MKSDDDLLSKVNSMAALSRAIRAFQDLRRVTSATLCPAEPTSCRDKVLFVRFLIQFFSGLPAGGLGPKKRSTEPLAFLMMSSPEERSG